MIEHRRRGKSTYNKHIHDLLIAMGNTFCETCSKNGWRIYHTPEKPCTAKRDVPTVKEG